MNQNLPNTAAHNMGNPGTKSVVAAAVAGGPCRTFTPPRTTRSGSLVGCGGRGTGAAANALSTTSGPIKLVAMADVFENRLTASYGHLKQAVEPQIDVPEDRKFVGFDAYQKAMDCLKPGDVAIFATPPAFRWVHFTYAIEKGLNVFMEKPVTVDGPTHAADARPGRGVGRRRTSRWASA